MVNSYLLYKKSLINIKSKDRCLILNLMNGNCQLIYINKNNKNLKI